MSSFGSGGWTPPVVVTPPQLQTPRKRIRVGLMADAGEITPQRNLLSDLLWLQTELIVLCGDQNYGPPSQMAARNANLDGANVRAVAGNHDLDIDAGAALWAHFTNHPPFPPGLPGCYHEVIGGMFDLVVINGGVNSSMQPVVGHPSVAAGGPIHTWVSGLTFATPHVVLAVHWPVWGPDSGTNRYLQTLDWDMKSMGVSLMVTGHIHRGWTGMIDGVRVLGVGGSTKLDATIGNSLPPTVSPLGLVEWIADARTHTAAILTVTPSGMSFEFQDTAGRVVYAGDVETPVCRSHRQTYEVIPPGGGLSDGTVEVSRSVGPMYVDAVVVAMASPSGVSVRLRLAGGPYITSAQPISAGATYLPLEPGFTTRWLSPGDRVVAEVTGAAGYVTSSLEVALHGRLL
jgi:Calcineurin-like phosphoesterase